MLLVQIRGHQRYAGFHPPKKTAAAEKSIEQQFIAALDNMTCFERARTDYLAVLGTMDICGTDKQSHSSNACINLIPGAK